MEDEIKIKIKKGKKRKKKGKKREKKKEQMHTYLHLEQKTLSSLIYMFSPAIKGDLQVKQTRHSIW